MSNTILIKHGETEPSPGTLLPGELGFAYGEINKLYIGSKDKTLPPIPAGGGGVSEKDRVAFVGEEDPQASTVPINADTYGGVPFIDFFDKPNSANRAVSMKKFQESMNLKADQTALNLKADQTYVDSRMIKIFNTTVKEVDAIDQESEKGFTKVCSILIPKITSDMYPEVCFSEKDAMSGLWSPIAESGDGMVKIFAKPGFNEITIPTIIIWR